MTCLFTMNTNFVWCWTLWPCATGLTSTILTPSWWKLFILVIWSCPCWVKLHSMLFRFGDCCQWCVHCGTHCLIYCSCNVLCCLLACDGQVISATAAISRSCSIVCDRRGIIICAKFFLKPFSVIDTRKSSDTQLSLFNDRALWMYSSTDYCLLV